MKLSNHSIVTRADKRLLLWFVMCLVGPCGFILSKGEEGKFAFHFTQLKVQKHVIWCYSPNSWHETC
jgi:hypothetical protein